MPRRAPRVSPRPKPVSAFARDVEEVIRSIPRGSTLSYGAVAGLAGRPGAPRAVLQVLRRAEGLPWWRVRRSDGSFAPQVAAEQARRLRAEGVALSGHRLAAAPRLSPKRVR